MSEIGKLTSSILDKYLNALYPYTIFIDPAHTPKASTGFDTLTISGAYPNQHCRGEAGSLNDLITWDVVLSKGTWSIELIHRKGIYQGILSIQFDSVEKGTIDCYEASDTFTNLTSITGITIPLTKKIELKLKVTGTNPSSGAYYMHISSIRLVRTA